MNSLLTIAPPDPRFPRENLDARGGFTWWYMDALDQQGNGIVIIWSFGLPFLPGYASAARAGAAPVARQRPSLNVALYRGHQPSFYSLQEFDPDDVEWQGERWRFGRSVIETAVHDGRRVLEVRLDVDVPGDASLRLQGEVRLEGVPRVPRRGDEYGARHDWAPFVGPSYASVRLKAGVERYDFDARAYFDGNTGTVALHDTGIDRWTWGRLPFEDRERIYYILWREPNAEPEAHGIEIDTKGRLESAPLEVHVDDWGSAFAGLRYPTSMSLARGGEPWLDVRGQAVLDSGPFYVRYFLEGQSSEATRRGKGEMCYTRRIDLGRHRPLVRMRVEKVGGSNSIWLPLFTGPRRGRVRRLLTQFTDG